MLTYALVSQRRKRGSFSLSSQAVGVLLVVRLRRWCDGGAAGTICGRADWAGCAGGEGEDHVEFATMST
jgi:tagatose-1,6-bisphosphate aldolase